MPRRSLGFFNSVRNISFWRWIAGTKYIKRLMLYYLKTTNTTVAVWLHMRSKNTKRNQTDDERRGYRISSFIPLLRKGAKHIKQLTIFCIKSNKATLYACKEILGESMRDWSQAIKFPTLASVCRSKTRTSVKDVIPDTSMVNWGTSVDVGFLWPSVRSKRSYADKYYLTTHCQNPMWRHQRWNTWRVWQSWNLYGKTLY